MKHTLHHVSVSQIQMSEDCERKWWFKNVQGLPIPRTKSQDLGVDVHKQIEHYLKTGQDALGPIARAGKHLLPAPGNDLFVEWGFDDRPHHEEKGHFNYAGSLVNAGAVPFEGYVDILHARNPELPEVWDHKSSSDIDKWALTEDELAQNTQAIVYANFALIKFPHADRVKVRFVYYATRGKPRAEPVSITLTRPEIEVEWAARVQHVKKLEAIATETNFEKAHPNFNACEKFGGCPFKSRCHATRGEKFIMSLIAKVRGDEGAKAPAGAVVNDGPGWVPISCSACGEVVGKRPPGSKISAHEGCKNPGGKLLRTETGEAVMITAKQLAVTDAPPVQPPEPLPQCKVTDEDGERCKLPKGHQGIHDCSPADVGSQEPKGDMSPPAKVQASGERSNASILPPDAPKSDPKLASIETPTSQPATPAPAPGAQADSSEGPFRRKRGRPTKAEAEARAQETAQASQAANVAPHAPTPAPSTPSVAANAIATEQKTFAPPKIKGLRLFINAIPHAEDYKLLDAYVAEKSAECAAGLNVLDVRLYEYGKGPGALAAVVRGAPPPPGTWVLIAPYGSLAQVVAEALIPIAEFPYVGVRS